MFVVIFGCFDENNRSSEGHVLVVGVELLLKSSFWHTIVRDFVGCYLERMDLVANCKVLVNVGL